jgi:hypothetical protein
MLPEVSDRFSFKNNNKKSVFVIPTTCEVEIRTVVQRPTWTKRSVGPTSTNKTWMWGHMPVIPATWEVLIQAEPGINTRPYQKTK